MDRKPFSRRTGWLAAAASLLVVAVLVAVFIFSQSRAPQEGIVLPQEPVTEAPPIVTPEESQTDSFVQITPENVLPVLQETLDKPTAYHQSYTVSVGADDAQSQRSVELWVNWPLMHGEVSDKNRTKTVISDGETAYLWYNSDPNYITVPLTDSVEIWDLLGLPAHDYLAALADAEITDADYLVLEDPRVQCAYVCTQAGDVTWRYWVELDSGLLYMTDVLERSTQVYLVRQTYLELLAQEDESFSGRFQLPDGTRPFAAEEE